MLFWIRASITAWHCLVTSLTPVSFREASKPWEPFLCSLGSYLITAGESEGLKNWQRGWGASCTIPPSWWFHHSGEKVHSLCCFSSLVMSLMYCNYISRDTHRRSSPITLIDWGYPGIQYGWWNITGLLPFRSFCSHAFLPGWLIAIRPLLAISICCSNAHWTRQGHLQTTDACNQVLWRFSSR